MGDPIFVRVKDGRWDCFSIRPNTAPTERDRQLYELLKNLGGVNENTEDGWYHFNAEALGEEHVVAHLDRTEPPEGGP